jgi:GTP cyclohydrolase I
MTAHKISYGELDKLVQECAEMVRAIFPNKTGFSVYPVPRGGIPAALALGQYIRLSLVSNPDEADFIMDDLVDSGATREKFPDKIFVCLIDKNSKLWKGKWIVWPWEETSERGINDHIVRLLQYVGEDSNRPGLLETPERVAKAWKFWCSGYGKNPAELLKTFEDGAERCDEMIVVKEIPFYTHCEHHLAPFFGTATIGYIPNGRIVGLSKLSRLLDMYARRLQVQERLTTQVADALMEHLGPLGAAVVLKARHLCMESRGVCQQGHHTVTSALRGVFKEDATARAEFLRLAGC